MNLSIALIDAQGSVIYEIHGTDFVQLDRMNQPYRAGDRLVITTDAENAELEMALDAGLTPSRVLLKGCRFEMPIPFDKAHRAYHPAAFKGDRLWGYVRAITPQERYNYRNLALNSHDLKDQEVLFPHATTNTGATDERFLARCALDGVTQTCLHGEWPYGSWGINGRDDAWLRVDFGQTVHAQQLILFLRADFPHDSWWQSAWISMSDGTRLELPLEKTGAPQRFELGERNISWICLHDFVRGDNGSFPALSQIQVWGTNGTED